MHSPFHVHLPDTHDLSVKIHNILHDERFWAFLGIIAFATLIILLALLTEGGSGSSNYTTPPYLP